MKLNNGRYEMQGVDLLEVCNEFGTPVYVYDADRIVAQIEKLRGSFSDIQVKLKYAMKALSNINILKLMKEAGVEIDTVSIQEVQMALHAGFEPTQILYTPNCVSFEEIRMAVEYGVVINIDNIGILEQFGEEFGNRVPLCIRVNPHLTAGGNSKIQVGHIGSKFGISVFQMRHVRKVVEHFNLNVVGLHMHSGSDFLESEVFLMAAEVLFNEAQHFPDLQFLDMGSGFKVAYKENDITTNIEAIGRDMSREFKKFCASYGRELELWFEPGKYLVSESGVFLVSTNVIKHSPAAVFAGVDSGLNHLIRPMMYGSHHDIVNISNPKGTQRVYDVVGYICETDTFGSDRKLNEVRQGDVLAMKNAGAYGFSMSSNYNSRFRPAEVMIYKGEAKLIRRRETFEDLLHTQIEVL
ncbi:diaminopimelate decarboxylase [Limibacter armeniacum]|uniref:diaminopimelate decarboxylase n=1 Tax=Limibacter armeniacum TaxID=466084 RepID=UPI002FE67634